MEPKNGAEIEPWQGAVPYRTDASWGSTVHVGSIKYGQSRDVVFSLRVPPAALSSDFVAVTVKFEVAVGGSEEKAAAEGGLVNRCVSLSLRNDILRFSCCNNKSLSLSISLSLLIFISISTSIPYQDLYPYPIYIQIYVYIYLYI